MLLDDVCKFDKALKDSNITIKSDTWVDEFEAGFEWISDNIHAYVGLEGDNLVRYTMKRGDSFISGSERDCNCDRIPEDLMEYLKNVR